MAIAEIASVDLEIIESMRPNLLLCGPRESIDHALAVLRPSFLEPISKWEHNGQDTLSHQLTGTLIIEGATSLDDRQQRMLIDWLDDNRRHVQVIATTPENLFPFAAEGIFRDRLFYRLNTLHIDLGCPN